MRAGQAGSLRLEVENVRVAEQERSLAEARQHLEQWDILMQHNACLESENAELRAELEAVLAQKHAMEAALQRTANEREIAAEAAATQQACLTYLTPNEVWTMSYHLCTCSICLRVMQAVGWIL